MSGFDVRSSRPMRQRAILFLSSVSLALLLISGVLIQRAGQESAAEAAAPDPEMTLAAAPADAEPAPITFEDLIAAEHEAFMSLCAGCASLDTRAVTVRRGQTFASVLSSAGAGRVEAARAIAALDPLFSARLLRAGQDLTLYFDASVEGEDGGPRLEGFSFRPDAERSFTVARSGDDGFRAREAQARFVTQIVRAAGEIDSNLYLAALRAGASDAIIFRMAEILGYAVDFRAIQYGDTFDVVFERDVTRGGDIARSGDILYLRFHGRGDPLEYFRFESENGEIGFYTGEGESARRLLMKVPINGARLSSQFGMRFHPVLRTNRPHNGTDFAAPRGTPIMAAGNGIVERANRFGSFGNYIRIRHANGYKTAYAHLNGFARGVRSGARVQQGQIIGYVGTTGRSTGPHLHYEVHLNGRPMNPMRLDLPEGRSLEDDELDAFMAERNRIIALRDSAPSADGAAPFMVAGAAESGDS
ncbi:MAG: M23 family metallopeptidase [Pseudomonadota bacterium]